MGTGYRGQRQVVGPQADNGDPRREPVEYNGVLANLCQHLTCRDTGFQHHKRLHKFLDHRPLQTIWTAPARVSSLPGSSPGRLAAASQSSP
jgi:hypothetical protein